MPPEERLTVVTEIDACLNGVSQIPWKNLRKHLGDEAGKTSKQGFICKGLWGITTATYYNWKNQKMNEGAMTDHRTDQKNRIPANKLSDKEIQQIIDEFNNRKEHGEESITAYSIAYSLMDKGEYVASPSTIARYIRAYMLEINPSLAERQIADEGLEKHHVSTGTLPEGIATGPNTVWVADTTYLNTDIKGKYYYLLTIMDLYSRKIVHWEIVEREEAISWERCLQQALIRERIADPSKIQFHTDNGSCYRASTFQAFLENKGIKYTHSRPLVSNDNAFMESFFSTLKRSDRVELKPFPSLHVARICLNEFIYYYNSKHLHSGINYMTPNDVHEGRDKEILEKRNRVKDAAKEQHPERFAKFTRLQPLLPVALTRRNDNLKKDQEYRMSKSF